jgi:hypothetical protein
MSSVMISWGFKSAVSLRYKISSYIPLLTSVNLWLWWFNVWWLFVWIWPPPKSATSPSVDDLHYTLLPSYLTPVQIAPVYIWRLLQFHIFFSSVLHLRRHLNVLRAFIVRIPGIWLLGEHYVNSTIRNAALYYAEGIWFIYKFTSKLHTA